MPCLRHRYAKAGNTTYYPRGEVVPEHRGTTGEWEDLVFKNDKRGRRRMVRMVYEIVTYQALRNALRCKEIWAVGAHSFRDPEEDLPKDFAARRVENYAELRKPLDPKDFIAELKAEMRAELEALNTALPKLDWVEIKDRKSGAIKLTKIGPAEEPRNLRKIKNEVSRRWGRGPADRHAQGGGAAHRLPERRHLGCGQLQPQARGAGRASHAGDLRLRHQHRDPGRRLRWPRPQRGRHPLRRPRLLIYWHIERGSMVVRSQTLRASASEVHAMIEGAVRHGTTMNVEGNYVDSHGQTEIGFGVTRLLGFDLLPRIKQINKVKLHRVESGKSDLYPRLTPAMTRPIRWDLIEQNYDQMIKYATAIKQGTASTEAILRRFTDSASHPTYQAMLEVGRAQKTIFVARYLRLRELQREIQEGLNVVESSNGANSVIFYGKGGDIATNRREELEMTVLCLRILQAALVYINTLMLQDVLADPQWAKLLKPADRRGLTPLFWQHVQPYGEVRLDVAKRLPLGGSPSAAQPGDPE
ncbi:hypothetical protein GCM10023075_21180 [Streptosporangium album]